MKKLNSRMKIGNGITRIKLAVLIVLVLSLHISTKSIKMKTESKISLAVFNKELAKLEDPLTDLNKFQEFFLGLLSTVGIKYISDAAFVFSSIMSDKLSKYFIDEVKIYKCDRQNYYEYFISRGVHALNEAEKLKYDSCASQTKKIIKKVEEMDFAVDCIAHFEVNKKICSDVDRLDALNKTLASFKLQQVYTRDNLMSAFKQIKFLRVVIDKEYIRVLDCQSNSIDNVFSGIGQFFKQGFYILKFVLFCVDDKKYKLGSLVFSQILNLLAKFLTGGMYLHIRQTAINIHKDYFL